MYVPPKGVVVRKRASGDTPAVRELLSESWGSEVMVVHGDIYHPGRLRGFVATEGGALVGLVTYRLEGSACEIVSLNSKFPRRGIGGSVLEAVELHAKREGCRRVRLTTTNDNINAISFFQNRGYRLVALRRDAVAIARRLKPEIPLVGFGGVPLRDELDLEKELS
jgi:ribosomal protein S18 acetylase RimI-like enzyme